jgi:stage V sporulation protein SpoVS
MSLHPSETAEPFRVSVIPIGRGYLAESKSFSISAGGASASEATEKARSIACEILTQYGIATMPSTIMVRIEEERYVAFVMRPFSKTFDLQPDDAETLYIDSSGNTKP